MEGQGRRWQMWKIRRRQERAKAWMAAEDRGVPRRTAERCGGRTIELSSVQSVCFSQVSERLGSAHKAVQES